MNLRRIALRLLLYYFWVWGLYNTEKNRSWCGLNVFNTSGVSNKKLSGDTLVGYGRQI